jgi:hypothetical protein
MSVADRALFNQMIWEVQYAVSYLDTKTGYRNFFFHLLLWNFCMPLEACNLCKIFLMIFCDCQTKMLCHLPPPKQCWFPAPPPREMIWLKWVCPSNLKNHNVVSDIIFFLCVNYELQKKIFIKILQVPVQKMFHGMSQQSFLLSSVLILCLEIKSLYGLIS